MKRISNFTIVFVFLCFLIGIVILKTIMVLSINHEKNLLHAMNSKVEYYAKRCYLEDKCHDKVTLDTLYALSYLDEVINPMTKEIIDGTTEIEYIDNKIIIHWKNN